MKQTIRPGAILRDPLQGVALKAPLSEPLQVPQQRSFRATGSSRAVVSLLWVFVAAQCLLQNVMLPFAHLSEATNFRAETVLPSEQQQEQGLYRNFEIDHRESPGRGYWPDGSPSFFCALRRPPRVDGADPDCRPSHPTLTAVIRGCTQSV
jgi:hypothetical protein